MNFASFDLNLLRVFDALLRERSATRAGALVGLSQPAVSAALNRLRHALEDQLFIRRGAAMVPTPKAEALGAPIAEALAQLERTLGGEARFEPAESDRTFTLIASDFFALALFPELMARLTVEAPRTRLRVLDIPRDGVLRPLLEGTADLALERAIPGPDWVARELLFRSPFALIAARDNPEIAAAGVPPGAPLPMDLYCRLPHVMRTIEGDMVGAVDLALAEIGRERRVALAVTQFPGVLMAVARTRMIAAVPAEIAAAFGAAAGVEIYAPPIDLPISPIEMIWHRRQTANPAHRWLRGRIVQTLKTLGLSPEEEGPDAGPGPR